MLRSEFLNFEQRSDGKYTKSELLRCRAYITFAHAEIENYFETASTSILNRAERRWDKSATAGNVVAALLCYRSPGESSLPDDPRDQPGSKTLPSRVKAAFKTQKNIVDANNGIRRKDIVKLFLPLGILANQFEEALLIQLDNFGGRRGDYVHKCAQGSLPHIRDPFADEESDLNYLLKELEKFDVLVQSIR